MTKNNFECIGEYQGRAYYYLPDHLTLDRDTVAMFPLNEFGYGIIAAKTTLTYKQLAKDNIIFYKIGRDIAALPVVVRELFAKNHPLNGSIDYLPDGGYTGYSIIFGFSENPILRQAAGQYSLYDAYCIMQTVYVYSMTQAAYLKPYLGGYDKTDIDICYNGEVIYSYRLDLTPFDLLDGLSFHGQLTEAAEYYTSDDYAGLAKLIPSVIKPYTQQEIQALVGHATAIKGLHVGIPSFAYCPWHTREQQQAFLKELFGTVRASIRISKQKMISAYEAWMQAIGEPQDDYTQLVCDLAKSCLDAKINGVARLYA
jgi:hypothetical protein